MRKHRDPVSLSVPVRYMPVPTLETLGTSPLHVDIHTQTLEALPKEAVPAEVVELLEQEHAQAKEPATQEAIRDILTRFLKLYAEEGLPPAMGSIVGTLLHHRAEDVVSLLLGMPGPLEALKELRAIADLADQLAPHEGLPEEEQIAAFLTQIERQTEYMADLEAALMDRRIGPWAIPPAEASSEELALHIKDKIAAKPGLYGISLDREDPSLDPATLSKLKNILAANSGGALPAVKEMTQHLLQRCADAKVDVLGAHSRSKGIRNLIAKLLGKADEYALGNVCDMVGSRLMVRDLEDMPAADRMIRATFSGKDPALPQCRTLEVENKFVQDKKAPYRAVHYIIEFASGQTFELQLMTYSNFIRSAIDHYVYKPEYKLTRLQQLLVELQSRASALDETIAFALKYLTA